jgi:hypothetical protein
VQPALGWHDGEHRTAAHHTTSRRNPTSHEKHCRDHLPRTAVKESVRCSAPAAPPSAKQSDRQLLRLKSSSGVDLRGKTTPRRSPPSLVQNVEQLMDVVSVETALAIACPCEQPDDLIGSPAEDGDPERREPALSDRVVKVAVPSEGIVVEEGTELAEQ